MRCPGQADAAVHRGNPVAGRGDARVIRLLAPGVVQRDAGLEVVPQHPVQGGLQAGQGDFVADFFGDLVPVIEEKGEDFQAPAIAPGLDAEVVAPHRFRSERRVRHVEPVPRPGAERPEVEHVGGAEAASDVGDQVGARRQFVAQAQVAGNVVR